jgi:hypothetical protein
LSLDFERLEYMRPGYGYSGIADRNRDIMAPEDMGIYRLDLETGHSELIISLAAMASIPHPTKDLTGCKHYCNCLLFNTDGSRFAFLHRWRPDKGRGWPFKTRLMTARPDGSELHVLIGAGCGHFTWQDSRHLLAQADGFWLYRDGHGRVRQIGKDVLPGSGGHISFLPQADWLVGDTYPDTHRNQHLYLYHIPTDRLILLGSFNSPLAYTGTVSENADDEWRCDLHPRLSGDGRFVTIDSPHGGNGRQMYLLDIRSVLEQTQ